MSINKENIEEHIFDYLEGNLTNEQTLEFRDYINSNSEAKQELADWKKSYVSDNIMMDSSEFSSLQKSNKLYYWIAGISIAFILGLTTSNIFFNKEVVNEVDVVQSEKAPIKTEQIIEESITTEVVKTVTKVRGNESGIVIESKKAISKDITESAPIENMEMISKREIDFDSAQSNREVISKKVTIKKDDQPKVMKNKEVDVIELNSEGF